MLGWRNYKKNTIKNNFKKSGIINDINKLSAEFIELPREIIMLNSAKDEDIEVLKKYNLDEKEIKANNTLDKFFF